MWVYYEWEQRKENIAALVKHEQPDIIALQEVQTNQAFSPYPSSDFVADCGGYPYRAFSGTWQRNDQIDANGNRTQRTSYGRALVSKYPILSSETYFLEKYPDHDEENSVQFCRLDIDGVVIDVCNVHLANTDKHSELHLREVVQLCKVRGIEPILLGDFNNFDLAQFKDTLLNGYRLTTDIAEYTSMPKDKGTLDYICVPATKFVLSDVTCPPNYVSDHRALITSVELLSR